MERTFVEGGVSVGVASGVLDELLFGERTDAVIAEDVMFWCGGFLEDRIHLLEPLDLDLWRRGFIDDVTKFDDEVGLGAVEMVNAFGEFCGSILVEAVAPRWFVSEVQVGDETDAEDRMGLFGREEAGS